MADDGIGASDEIAKLSLGNAPGRPPIPPPLFPTAKASGIVAVDITERFSRAVKGLSPGELVKDGFFTLFDSVAALEIMDPKMDSGCVRDGDELEVRYNVARPLLPEEVLGIMDQLLCHEMSWHLGYPLSQTIFTSVYVDALLMPPEPNAIEEAVFVRFYGNQTNRQPMLQVLRAYCLGLIKACGFVNELVKSEHFYEEEDFVPNTYNRTLLDNIPFEAVQEVLAEAKLCVSSLAGSISENMSDALLSRLELREAILRTAESPQHKRDAAKARAPWRDGLEILPRVKETHRLGKSVDDAFSTKMQRKLASTMPPRPIVELAFVDAIGHLSRLFDDGLEVISVLQYTDSQCLQKFVSTFQSKRPQPMVYARSLLQTFIFSDMEILGTMSIRQLLDDDLSIITLPASPLLDRANDEIEAVQDPRFAMSQQMELFRQRAAQPFLDILRTSCQNRCRVRRTLCHMIRDWENLQADAEDIDTLLQVKTKEQPVLQQSHAGAMQTYSLPLSSWTYLYKIQQMEWIVQLGFELQVYQDDELAGMYWYLNYLAKSRLTHAERIKTFVVHRARTAGASIDPATEKQLHRALAFTRLSLLSAAVTWELADALSCLYVVLSRLGAVKSPSRPYSNDELRYELRMRPFAAIGLPALPTFQEFTEGVDQPDAGTEGLLSYAEQAVAGAKRGLEALTKLSAEESFSVGSHERWAASAKGALRSCIATSLAITTVKKALEKKDAADVRLKAEVPLSEKAYHEWWLVPRVSPRPEVV